MQVHRGSRFLSNQLATRLQPGQFIDDVFRVYGVAKRTRNHGRDHFFLVTLGDGTGRFNAIVGKEAVRLALGQIVRVCGCVLVRQGHPILVVGWLRPITSKAYASRLRFNRHGKAQLPRLGRPAHRLYPRTQREPQ